MKKGLLAILLFLLVFAFVGCVDDKTTTTSTSQSTTSTQTTNFAPVISGADDVTIEKNSTFVPLAGVSATDYEDGDLTSAIQYKGDVNPNAVGVYTATYSVVDSDGNPASVTRKVTVVFTDSQAPLLSGISDTTIFVGQAFDPKAGVSATDTVDGSVEVTVTGTVDVWTEGDYELTYYAEDKAGNKIEDKRTVTVTFGDFAFESPVQLGDFTLADSVLSSPAFSGGVITPTLANFTYVKVLVHASATAAGDVTVALGEYPSHGATLSLTTTEADYIVYFVIDAALTDAVITINCGDLTVENLAVTYSFATIRDMVQPTFVVPSDEAAFVVGGSIEDLRALLLDGVKAVDDIDGNITSSITIDYKDLDINTVGVYNIEYKVSDAGGNEATYTRKVTIGNLVDAGVVTDPLFQNQGDGLWSEKSNDGKATITYDAANSAMNVTVSSLGSYLSAAGTFLKVTTDHFEVGQWYMFTFTVKTSIDRTMGFRMGLMSDSSHGWIDDFDGRSDHQLALTSEYQTFSFYFTLDSLTSTSGSNEFIIELNLGNLNYSNIGKDGVTTFTNVALYKVVTEFEAPTYTVNQGADLPTKLTVGSTAPDFTKYVTFLDMSKNVLTPVIDSSALDLNTAGTYDIVYTATDSHDKSTTYTLQVQVVSAENADTTGPVITVSDQIPTTFDQFTNVTIDVAKLLELGYVTATDAVDGAITITAAMVDDGGLNFNVAGVYTITVTVYDQSGNTSQETLQITVVDKEAPTINASDQTVNIGDDFDALAKVTVTDNVDGTIAIENVTVDGLDAFLTDGRATAVGTFTITYTVSDALGNSATKSVEVTVVNLEWDESTRTPLGESDEAVTHSTVTYDDTEGAYLITAIDPNVQSWDHARWVYYLNAGTDLIAGYTYKLEITVKSTVATDLYFRIGSTLWVDPWIDNFTGGLKTISIDDEYTTYQVIFTVDKAMPAGSAKLQFMYGYLASDAENTIYVKSFDLVQEGQPTYTDVINFGDADEAAHLTDTFDTESGVYTLSNIEYASISWDPSRLVYYVSDANLVQGKTYQITFTAKADVATRVDLRIGSTLWVDPWIDNFDGGLLSIDLTTDYVTYVFMFTVDKAIPNGTAKFQFMTGYLSTDAGNTIILKDFKMQMVTPFGYHSTYVFNDFEDYADNTAYQAATEDNIEGTRIGSGTFVKSNGTLIVDGDNQLLSQNVSATTGTNGIKIRITKDTIADNINYIAFWVKATDPTNMVKFQSFIYDAAGGYKEITASIEGDFTKLGSGVYVYIPVSALQDDTIIVSLVVNVNAGATGQLLFDNIMLVEDYIQIPNEAPQVSMSDANQQLIASQTFTAGTALDTLEATLLSMLEISDAEDGVITPIASMIDYNGLDLTNPAMGTYTIKVKTVDSEGKESNELTITVSIVTVIENFNSYADDADFKANYAGLYGFRVNGGGWDKANGTLVADGDNNLLSLTYGAGTNGIRLNVSQTSLVALNAEYVGIYVKTSAEVTGSSSVFQAFYYDAAGYHQMTTYGTISYTDGGTYVFVKVSELSESTTGISLMVNLASGNTGTLTLDNVVIK